MSDRELDEYLAREIDRLLHEPKPFPPPEREQLYVPDPVPMMWRGFLEEGVYFARTEFSPQTGMLWKPLYLGNGKRILSGTSMIWITCHRGHQMSIGEGHIDPETGRGRCALICPKCEAHIPMPWYLENWRDS